MNPGKLDRQVELLQPQNSPTSFGGTDQTWVVAGVVWAEVRDLRGREYFIASQEHHEITTRFIVRHRSDIAPNWRLRLDGVEYDITQISRVGRRVSLDILANARPADGSA